MLNVKGCINQRFTFKNSSISIQVRQSCIQKKQFQVTRYNESYTIFKYMVWTYGSVVKASSIKIGYLGSTLAGCWNSCLPQPFCVAWNLSVHWHVRFYIAALSIIFFLGFLQWLSRADSVLTLNMNILFRLFWSTWSRAEGQDSATSAGLVHGRDYSYCRAPDSGSEQSHKRCLAHKLSKIIENKGQ